jgi:hypothetical protein
MAEITPERPWPELLLANVVLNMGQKEKAVAALTAAVQRGFRDPAYFKQPEFAALAPLPAFQALIAGLEPSAN